MSFIITKNNSLPYAYKNHCYRIYKPKVKNHLKNALNRAFELCETMLSHYKKVFVVRVDLHPKKYSPTNKNIGLYLQSEKVKLQKLYKCKVEYFCAREQVDSHKEHYHVVLMLSGHKIQHPSKLVSNMSESWEKYCGGNLAKVKHAFSTMVRGNKSSIDPVIYRISYLTKQYSKELNHSVRNFINSRLKPKLEIDKNCDLLLVNPQITYTKNNSKRYYSLKKSKLPSGTRSRVIRKYGWFTANKLPINIDNRLNTIIPYDSLIPLAVIKQ
ncbi:MULTISPECIES: inovirus-type Gp2 protein [unclassified Shewanella]|uniref:YagK/YfjJ domain-containing protein n=1 Tax=unclassified Shewanella TaxID=196818 RepID=UPI00354F3D8F